MNFGESGSSRTMTRLSPYPLGVVIMFLSLFLTAIPSAYSQGNYGLVYNLNYTTPVYPGGSTVLVNVFKNTGTVLEQVTGVTLTSDLGTFTPSSGLPVTVPVSQSVELNMTEQIPSSASVSSHAVTAAINFQYQDPSSLQWVTPTSSPLAVQGAVNITSNPANALGLGVIILGVIAALAVAVVLLVIRMKRKRQPVLPPPTFPSQPLAPT